MVEHAHLDLLDHQLLALLNALLDLHFLQVVQEHTHAQPLQPLANMDHVLYRLQHVQ
jgi:hypothetical protein